MSSPRLIFAVPAWGKLQFFLHKSSNEVAGYGVSLDINDPLYINEFAIVKQEGSSSFVEMDGEDVDDFFHSCRERGLKPGQFGNIWIHTHPEGMGANPSGQDETTFKNNFGQCPWAIMAIISKRGDTYARLQYNLGQAKMETEIPIQVDWANWHKQLGGPTRRAWDEEFATKLRQRSYSGYNGTSGYNHSQMGFHSGHGGSNRHHHGHYVSTPVGTNAANGPTHWQEHWQAQKKEASENSVISNSTTSNSSVPGTFVTPAPSNGSMVLGNDPPAPEGYVPGIQPGTWRRHDTSNMIWKHVGWTKEGLKRWTINPLTPAEMVALQAAEDAKNNPSQDNDNLSSLEGEWIINTNGESRFHRYSDGPVQNDTVLYQESSETVGIIDAQIITDADVTFTPALPEAIKEQVILTPEETKVARDLKHQQDIEAMELQAHKYADPAVALNNLVKYTQQYEEYMQCCRDDAPESLELMPSTEYSLLAFYGFEYGDKVVVEHPVNQIDQEIAYEHGIFEGWAGIHEQKPFLALVKFDRYPNPVMVHPDSLEAFVAAKHVLSSCVR